MKLRNKKTGDIVYVDFQIPLCNNDNVLGSYSVTSLKELNESFEDYEENRVQIKIEKRPLEERILNLEIKMADAEDDIVMLKDKIAEFCRRKNDIHH